MDVISELWISCENRRENRDSLCLCFSLSLAADLLSASDSLSALQSPLVSSCLRASGSGRLPPVLRSVHLAAAVASHWQPWISRHHQRLHHRVASLQRRLLHRRLSSAARRVLKWQPPATTHTPAVARLLVRSDQRDLLLREG